LILLKRYHQDKKLDGEGFKEERRNMRKNPARTKEGDGMAFINP
jgi:hypothetical protein